jgi:hypothetical protein
MHHYANPCWEDVGSRLHWISAHSELRNGIFNFAVIRAIIGDIDQCGASDADTTGHCP